MATLVFKVFSLTVKSAAKPLAAQFERYVMNHPVLRTKVINLAQALHRFDVRMTRGAEGREGRVFVGDMSEEKAMQLASKVVSEGFLYTTAIGLLLLETDRRSKEDAAKKAKAEAERRENAGLHERHLQTERDIEQRQKQLQEVLERMEERLSALEALQVNAASRKSGWFG